MNAITIQYKILVAENFAKFGGLPIENATLQINYPLNSYHKYNLYGTM